MQRNMNANPGVNAPQNNYWDHTVRQRRNAGKSLSGGLSTFFGLSWLDRNRPERMIGCDLHPPTMHPTLRAHFLVRDSEAL
jgi:hypothetical protein